MLALLAACALGGCSGEGADYPSLASRPAERLTDAAQPARPGPTPGPAAAAPTAQLAVRLDRLVAQARSAHRDFDDKRAAAERLISAAGAAPAGSEGWARATQALSGIESDRSRTAQPLVDLDRIDIDDHLAHPAKDGPDSDRSTRPDAMAIAQARETVSALVADEDAVLARLDGRLAR